MGKRTFFHRKRDVGEFAMNLSYETVITYVRTDGSAKNWHAADYKS